MAVVKRSGLFYDRRENGFISERPRLYSAVLQEHLQKNRQMALVSGPRQVGKTTVCRSLGDAYLNWDNSDDRRRLLSGPPVAVLDELHKYSKWKSLLKGFFDTYGERVRLLITGSSRMDVFRRGGDSLMGRYLLYSMHPWSTGECLRTDLLTQEIQPADCFKVGHPVVVPARTFLSQLL